MRSALVLVAACLARTASSAPLRSALPVATPGPVHRYVNSYVGNNCSGTTTSFADLGSSAIKLPLNGTSAVTCDTTQLGFYNAGNNVGAYSFAANGTISDGSRSVTLVFTQFVNVGSAGTPSLWSATFKPFVGGPSIAYTISAMGGAASVSLATPSCRSGVSFSYQTAVIPQQQIAIVFDSVEGVRMYMNGAAMLRGYTAGPTNQNCRLGVKNIWTSRPGTFTITAGIWLVGNTYAALQDLQIYNYPLTYSQVASLVPSAVVAPPPPPSTVSNALADVANVNDFFAAAVPLLSHRYLGRSSEPAPFVNGVLIDQVGSDNGSVALTTPTQQPQFSLNTNLVELGNLNHTAGPGDLTIRILGNILNAGSSAKFTIRYHNFQYEETGGSFTVSSDISGASATRNGLSSTIFPSSTPMYSYLTITVGASGTRIFVGGRQVASFAAVASSVYTSPHSAWAAIYTTGNSNMNLYDIQFYDVELTPATVIALDQGEIVTSML